MIKFENTSVMGFDEAIRGMRNPMNSWDKSDSYFSLKSMDFQIGDNDYALMLKLSKAGSEHAKYKRMIIVYVDITAPLYLWKELDTYKVGTVRNSCSTMHRITSKPIELSDFSIDDFYVDDGLDLKDYFVNVVADCEKLRQKYLETKDKRYWRGLIQLLPESYNQKSTMLFNYENLTNVYRQRKGHKLEEWNDFRTWIETLPYCGLLGVDDGL